MLGYFCSYLIQETFISTSKVPYTQRNKYVNKKILKPKDVCHILIKTPNYKQIKELHVFRWNSFKWLSNVYAVKMFPLKFPHQKIPHRFIFGDLWKFSISANIHRKWVNNSKHLNWFIFLKFWGSSSKPTNSEHLRSSASVSGGFTSRSFQITARVLVHQLGSFLGEVWNHSPPLQTKQNQNQKGHPRLGGGRFNKWGNDIWCLSYVGKVQ